MRLSPKQLLLIVAALAVVLSAVIAIQNSSNRRRTEEAKAEQLRREEARANAQQEVSEGVNRFTEKLKVPSGPTLWGEPPPAKKTTPEPVPAQR